MTKTRWLSGNISQIVFSYCFSEYLNYDVWYYITDAVNFETDTQTAGPATYIMVPVPETTTENVPIWLNCNIYRNFVNVHSLF